MVCLWVLVFLLPQELFQTEKNKKIKIYLKNDSLVLIVKKMHFGNFKYDLNLPKQIRLNITRLRLLANISNDHETKIHSCKYNLK